MAEKQTQGEKKEKKKGRKSMHYQLLFRFLKLMNGRFSYEDGLKLDEIAKALYGNDDPVTKQRARALISRARKFLRVYGLDLYSTIGRNGYRYYILAKPEDYKKVMELLNGKLRALQSTQMYLLGRTAEIASNFEEWQQKLRQSVEQLTTLLTEIETQLASGNVEKALETLAAYKKVLNELSNTAKSLENPVEVKVVGEGDKPTNMGGA